MATRSTRTTTTSRAKKVALFEKFIGIRKLGLGAVLAAVGLFSGLTITTQMVVLILGIYGFFCVANAVEYLGRGLAKKNQDGPNVQLQALLERQELINKKLLDSQALVENALATMLQMMKAPSR